MRRQCNSLFFILERIMIHVCSGFTDVAQHRKKEVVIVTTLSLLVFSEYIVTSSSPFTTIDPCGRALLGLWVKSSLCLSLVCHDFIIAEPTRNTPTYKFQVSWYFDKNFNGNVFFLMKCSSLHQDDNLQFNHWWIWRFASDIIKHILLHKTVFILIYIPLKFGP